MSLKRFLSLALPAFAAVGVAGSGFATWYYVYYAKSKAQQAAVSVTKKMPSSFGSLSISFGSKDAIDYAPEGTTPKLFVSQRGVDFPSPISLSFKWNDNPTGDFPFSSFLYTFQYKITLEENFSSYFRFYLPKNSLASSLEGYWHLDGADKEITDFETPIASNIKFSLGYKDGKVPNTFADYQKIRELILSEEGDSPLLRFEFSLSVKAKGESA